jgi:prolyl oligopeptidase
VLIRIDVKAGHGAGKSLAATENVDIQAFTLYNMGFKNYQKLNNLDFIWS